ncbi:MAG: PrsW family intramembrane metalloprotease [SAR324 cluster bacterium]|nr:PrsW family intramembrane metalloprotease [SAR324 cluster bacterium]
MLMYVISFVVTPLLLWGWGLLRFHRYKRLNLKVLMLFFVAGAVSGLIALLMNHSIEKYTMFWPDAEEQLLGTWDTGMPVYAYGFWFLVGFNEEFAKMLVLLMLFFPFRFIEEPLDGIFYSVTVAMGFATLENLFYVSQYGYSILMTRSIVTLPAHMFMSVPVGYFVAKSRLLLEVRPLPPLGMTYSIRYILAGWFLSSFLHGFYDFILSTEWRVFAYVQILLMIAMAIILSRHVMRVSPYKPPAESLHTSNG